MNNFQFFAAQRRVAEEGSATKCKPPIRPGAQMMTSYKPKLMELFNWIDSHLIYCFSNP